MARQVEYQAGTGELQWAFLVCLQAHATYGLGFGVLGLGFRDRVPLMRL